MRTGHSLTICCSLLPRVVSAPAGCLLPGVSAPGGCLLPGVSAPGGCLLPGVSAPGGVCSWGVSASGGSVCSQGVSAVGGVCSQAGGVSALGMAGGVCFQGCLLPGGCLLLGVSHSKGGLLPGGCIPAYTEADTLPPCGQNSWHTLLKILPWPNFVAAGNDIRLVSRCNFVE